MYCNVSSTFWYWRERGHMNLKWFNWNLKLKFNYSISSSRLPLIKTLGRHNSNICDYILPVLPIAAIKENIGVFKEQNFSRNISIFAILRSSSPFDFENWPYVRFMFFWKNSICVLEYCRRPLVYLYIYIREDWHLSTRKIRITDTIPTRRSR